MYEIEIADNQSHLVVDGRLLRQAIQSVLMSEGIERAEISLAVVDDPAIHALNRKYLDHDYATDVLSFLLDHENGKLDGEIIVSSETAIRQAAEFGATDPCIELLLYVIHGALHLAGYEDGTPAQSLLMREQEQKHLTALLGETPQVRSGD